MEEMPVRAWTGPGRIYKVSNLLLVDVKCNLFQLEVLLVGCVLTGGALCPPSSEELRRMQEQMQRLQQQLEANQKASSSSSAPVTTKGRPAGPKTMTPKPTPPRQPTSKLTQAKPATTTQKTKTQAGKHFVVICG